MNTNRVKSISHFLASSPSPSQVLGCAVDVTLLDPFMPPRSMDYYDSKIKEATIILYTFIVL